VFCPYETRLRAGRAALGEKKGEIIPQWVEIGNYEFEE
jgi:hypothetical protein